MYPFDIHTCVHCVYYMFQIHSDVLTIEKHVHTSMYIHNTEYSMNCNQIQLLSSMYQHISKIIWSDVWYMYPCIPNQYKSFNSQWFAEKYTNLYESYTINIVQAIAFHQSEIMESREWDRLSKTISFFTTEPIKQIVTNEIAMVIMFCVWKWIRCRFFWWFSIWIQDGISMFWRMDENHWSVQYIFRSMRLMLISWIDRQSGYEIEIYTKFFLLYRQNRFIGHQVRLYHF